MARICNALVVISQQPLESLWTEAAEPALFLDRSRGAGLAFRPKPRSRPRFWTEAAEPASLLDRSRGPASLLDRSRAAGLALKRGVGGLTVPTQKRPVTSGDIPVTSGDKLCPWHPKAPSSLQKIHWLSGQAQSLQSFRGSTKRSHTGDKLVSAAPWSGSNPGYLQLETRR